MLLVLDVRRLMLPVLSSMLMTYSVLLLASTSILGMLSVEMVVGALQVTPLSVDLLKAELPLPSSQTM